MKKGRMKGKQVHTVVQSRGEIQYSRTNWKEQKMMQMILNPNEG
jgi:hypothetical protein